MYNLKNHSPQSHSPNPIHKNNTHNAPLNSRYQKYKTNPANVSTLIHLQNQKIKIIASNDNLPSSYCDQFQKAILKKIQTFSNITIQNIDEIQSLYNVQIQNLQSQNSFGHKILNLMDQRSRILKQLKIILVKQKISNSSSDKKLSLNLSYLGENLSKVRDISLRIIQHLALWKNGLNSIQQDQYSKYILYQISKDIDFLRLTPLRKFMEFSSSQDPLILYSMKKFWKLQLTTNYNSRAIVNLFEATEQYKKRLLNAQRFTKCFDSSVITSDYPFEESQVDSQNNQNEQTNYFNNLEPRYQPSYQKQQKEFIFPTIHQNGLAKSQSKHNSFDSKYLQSSSQKAIDLLKPIIQEAKQKKYGRSVRLSTQQHQTQKPDRLSRSRQLNPKQSYPYQSDEIQTKPIKNTPSVNKKNKLITETPSKAFIDLKAQLKNISDQDNQLLNQQQIEGKHMISIANEKRKKLKPIFKHSLTQQHKYLKYFDVQNNSIQYQGDEEMIQILPQKAQQGNSSKKTIKIPHHAKKDLLQISQKKRNQPQSFQNKIFKKQSLDHNKPVLKKQGKYYQTQDEFASMQNNQMINDKTRQIQLLEIRKKQLELQRALKRYQLAQKQDQVNQIQQKLNNKYEISKYTSLINTPKQNQIKHQIIYKNPKSNRKSVIKVKSSKNSSAQKQIGYEYKIQNKLHDKKSKIKTHLQTDQYPSPQSSYRQKSYNLSNRQIFASIQKSVQRSPKSSQRRQNGKIKVYSSPKNYNANIKSKESQKIFQKEFKQVKSKQNSDNQIEKVQQKIQKKQTINRVVQEKRLQVSDKQQPYISRFNTSLKNQNIKLNQQKTSQQKGIRVNLQDNNKRNQLKKLNEISKQQISLSSQKTLSNSSRKQEKNDDLQKKNKHIQAQDKQYDKYLNEKLSPISKNPIINKANQSKGETQIKMAVQTKVVNNKESQIKQINKQLVNKKLINVLKPQSSVQQSNSNNLKRDQITIQTTLVKKINNDKKNIEPKRENIQLKQGACNQVKNIEIEQKQQDRQNQSSLRIASNVSNAVHKKNLTNFRQNNDTKKNNPLDTINEGQSHQEQSQKDTSSPQFKPINSSHNLLSHIQPLQGNTQSKNSGNIPYVNQSNKAVNKKIQAEPKKQVKGNINNGAVNSDKKIDNKEIKGYQQKIDRNEIYKKEGLIQMQKPHSNNLDDKIADKNNKVECELNKGISPSKGKDVDKLRQSSVIVNRVNNFGQQNNNVDRNEEIMKTNSKQSIQMNKNDNMNRDYWATNKKVNNKNQIILNNITEKNITQNKSNPDFIRNNQTNLIQYNKSQNKNIVIDNKNILIDNKLSLNDKKVNINDNKIHNNEKSNILQSEGNIDFDKQNNNVKLQNTPNSYIHLPQNQKANNYQSNKNIDLSNKNIDQSSKNIDFKKIIDLSSKNIGQNNKQSQNNNKSVVTNNLPTQNKNNMVLNQKIIQNNPTINHNNSIQNNPINNLTRNSTNNLTNNLANINTNNSTNLNTNKYTNESENNLTNLNTNKSTNISENNLTNTNNITNTNTNLTNNLTPKSIINLHPIQSINTSNSQNQQLITNQNNQQKINNLQNINTTINNNTLTSINNQINPIQTKYPENSNSIISSVQQKDISNSLKHNQQQGQSKNQQKGQQHNQQKVQSKNQLKNQQKVQSKNQLKNQQKGQSKNQLKNQQKGQSKNLQESQANSQTASKQQNTINSNALTKCVFQSKSLSTTQLSKFLQSYKIHKNVITQIATGYFSFRHISLNLCLLNNQVISLILSHPAIISEQRMTVLILFKVVSPKYLQLSSRLLSTTIRYLFYNDPCQNIVLLKPKSQFSDQSDRSIEKGFAKQIKNIKGKIKNIFIQPSVLNQRISVFEDTSFMIGRKQMSCKNDEIYLNNVQYQINIVGKQGTKIPQKAGKLQFSYQNKSTIQKLFTLNQGSNLVKTFKNKKLLQEYIEQQQIVDLSNEKALQSISVNESKQLYLYERLLCNFDQQVKFMSYGGVFYFMLQQNKTWYWQKNNIGYFIVKCQTKTILTDSKQNQSQNKSQASKMNDFVNNSKIQQKKKLIEYYYVFIDYVFQSQQVVNGFQLIKQNIQQKHSSQVLISKAQFQNKIVTIPCFQSKLIVDRYPTDGFILNMRMNLNWKNYLKGVRSVPQQSILSQYIAPFYLGILMKDQNNIMRMVCGSFISQNQQRIQQ